MIKWASFCPNESSATVLPPPLPPSPADSPADVDDFFLSFFLPPRFDVDVDPTSSSREVAAAIVLSPENAAARVKLMSPDPSVLSPLLLFLLPSAAVVVLLLFPSIDGSRPGMLKATRPSINACSALVHCVLFDDRICSF